MKIVLTFKDGHTKDCSSGNDAPELDLSTMRNELFSIVVSIEDKIAFSAYYWDNMPEDF